MEDFSEPIAVDHQGYEQELTEQLVDQILAKLHPVVAEGLFLASIPHVFDRPLIAYIRTTEDGKDEKLISRLDQLSFVNETITDERTAYQIEQLYRHILNRRFIQSDRAEYIAAHKRTYEYWRIHPSDEASLQAQYLVFHGLISECDQANPDLVSSIGVLANQFRVYADERQISRIQRLVDAAEEAYVYLELLDCPWRQTLRDVLQYLQARTDQMLGNWDDSLESLKRLKDRPDLWESLSPFVARGYGSALSRNGDYVGGISEFKTALRGLTQVSERMKADLQTGLSWNMLEAERGATMIELGDAHAGLALSARGKQETLEETKLWAKVRNWIFTFLALPMVIYLWFYLGWTVLNPRFWATLRGEDWLIVRLFAISSAWYKAADPVLEAFGFHSESVAADERLAYLYLQMGADDQAAKQLQALLDESEAPLGDYRRASVELRLAEAKLGLGRPGQAFVLLSRALPILRKFEDQPLVARTLMLLGESLYEMGDIDDAIEQLDQASSRFKHLEDWASVTEISERVEQILTESDVPPHIQSVANPLIYDIPVREYPIRFVHPLLKWFRAFLILSLAAGMLIIPILVMDFEVLNGLVPTVSFRPGPLLDLDGAFAANLSQNLQDAAAGTVEIDTNATSILAYAIIAVVLYILVTLLLGMLVIIYTPLATIQRSREGGLVRITASGISIGSGDQADMMNWADVGRVIWADVRFFPRSAMNASTIAICDHDDRRIWVKGTTRRYNEMRRWIDRRLPDNVTQENLDYTASTSYIFYLYILGLVIIWPMMLFTRIFQSVIWMNWFGQYSLGTAYPYLFILMFVPVMWWIIGRPVWHQAALYSKDRWYLTLFGYGVIALLAQLATRFMNLFTVPDIYPPLTTIACFAGGTYYLTRATLQGKPSYPTWVRTSALIITILISSIMAFRVGRDAVAYHLLTRARNWNGLAARERESRQAASEVAVQQALQDFRRAEQISKLSIPVVEFDFATGEPLSDGLFQDPSDHLWVQAVRDRAILEARIGDFSAATVDLERIIPYVEDPATLYVSSAVSYGPRYVDAITEYNKAIALAPDEPTYYLWRGVTHQAAGESLEAAVDYLDALRINRGLEADDQMTARQQAQVHTGLGWLFWGEDRWVDALDQFQLATIADPTYEEAYIGEAYAFYSLDLYTLAGRSFEAANRIAPDDELPLIGLGTVRWREATFANNPSLAQDVCSLSEATLEDRLEAEELLEESVDYFSRATQVPGQNPEDVAFTYRTMGQVEYLLRDCPNKDKEEQYRLAIEHYTNAIKLDRDNASFWQLRGRLRYALVFIIEGRPKQRDRLLYNALDDLDQALVLDPDNETTLNYLNIVSTAVANLVGEENLAAYRAAVSDGTVGDRRPPDFGCGFNYRFVSDETVQDGTEFDPLTPFEKSWRIRNNGLCDWDENTSWVFVDGDRMDGPLSIPVPPAVRGEEVIVTVSLISPVLPGTYQGDWTLQPMGEDRLERTARVQIVVPDPNEYEDPIPEELDESQGQMSPTELIIDGMSSELEDQDSDDDDEGNEDG